MGVRVGIDTGGTFTDLVAVDDANERWFLAKVPSNPDHPVQAITAAIEQAGFDPGEVDFVVVGTTIGINAVLTRTGARVRFLTTKGFEDIPFIQRINRKHHYDFSWRKPQALTTREDCFGLDERVNSMGRVVERVHPEQVREAVAGLNGGRPVAVAVCLLFAYANPENERLAREAIAEENPDLHVSLSHEVAPIWREYERGTATMVDAYLKPAVDDYVDGVSQAFADQGVKSNWSLLKSNGGHALADQARERPSHVLLSGIAGGAIGGAFFARERGADQAIVADMGGTSCDVCLIVDGEPLYSSEYEIEFGLPVSVPTVSSKTIGAGGGSIGWIDPGGFLQVGPQSAGADPGPACYERGGTEPTVTDADLLLGRLDPDFFLGGNLHLEPEASRQAMEKIGRKIGLDPIETAASMVRIANENMANAIRIVTVEQGIDPRGFALVAMGGAGPTHAAEIAEAIGVKRVLVPLNPGLSSAFGALAAQVRVDELLSVSFNSGNTTAADLVETFADLEERAVEAYQAQSPEQGEPVIERLISMRYEGQNYEQEVPVPNGDFDDAELADCYERYHQLHESFYGYRFDAVPIEMVRIGVAVSGEPVELPALRSESAAEGEAAEREERTHSAHFGDHGFLDTPVIPRHSLGEGERAGPLIVESMDTTVVVPPGWTLISDGGASLELRHHASQTKASQAQGSQAQGGNDE